MYRDQGRGSDDYDDKNRMEAFNTACHILQNVNSKTGIIGLRLWNGSNLTTRVISESSDIIVDGRVIARCWMGGIEVPRKLRLSNNEYWLIENILTCMYANVKYVQNNGRWFLHPCTDARDPLGETLEPLGFTVLVESDHTVYRSPFWECETGSIYIRRPDGSPYEGAKSQAPGCVSPISL